ALVEAVETFSEFQHQFNSESCHLQAAKFSPKIFEKSYLEFLEDCCQKSSSENSEIKFRFL
ncbi:MAG: hypothetical protein ACREPR_17650, partial [Brasilonema sp.]